MRRIGKLVLHVVSFDGQAVCLLVHVVSDLPGSVSDLRQLVKLSVQLVRPMTSVMMVQLRGHEPHDRGHVTS
jgi:hypothetical protein